MGYIKHSRSERSQEAIENYEVPLTMFKRDIINDFIDDNSNFEQLRNLPLTLWKYAANIVGASSWHHTSSFYNETNHYSLYDVAEYLLDANIDSIKAEIKKNNAIKKGTLNKAIQCFGVAKVQVWGGTRKHPCVISIDTVAGTIKGDWLIERCGKRYKLSANKTISWEKFESKEDLLKKYPKCAYAF
jgi:hypothetical protein